MPILPKKPGTAELFWRRCVFGNGKGVFIFFEVHLGHHIFHVFFGGCEDFIDFIGYIHCACNHFFGQRPQALTNRWCRQKQQQRW